MFQLLLPEALADQSGEFIRRLRDASIATGVRYPAIHQTTLYRNLGLARTALPHTKSVAAHILPLPQPGRRPTSSASHAPLINVLN